MRGLKPTLLICTLIFTVATTYSFAFPRPTPTPTPKPTPPPTSKRFTVIDESTTSVLGNNVMKLFNGSSGHDVTVLRIFMFNSDPSLPAADTVRYHMTRITAVSGGTALYPVPMDTNDVLPTGIQAVTGGGADPNPGAGTPGYLLLIPHIIQDIGGRDNTTRLIWDTPLVLHPGEGIAIQQVTIPASPAGIVEFLIDFLVD